MIVAKSSVLGPRKIVEINAHEGPVYVADEHALYFTSFPRPRPHVAIRRLDISGGEITTVVDGANAANGMTLDRDGRIVVCEQGTRMSDARISRLDLRTGARETVVTPVQRTALVVKSKNAAIPLLDEGARLPGMIYQEAVEPLGGGQVIASFLDGSPAMVVSSHGKGKTLYVGSYLSLAYERTKDSQSQGFFQGLLDWAGVERPVSASPGIEVRSLEGSNYKLEFVLNGAEKEVPAEVRLRPPFPAPSVRDLVTGQTVSYRRDGDRIVLSKSLQAQSAWVLEIREGGR